MDAECSGLRRPALQQIMDRVQGIANRTRCVHTHQTQRLAVLVPPARGPPDPLQRPRAKAAHTHNWHFANRLEGRWF